jgi:hypothetical protein
MMAPATEPIISKVAPQMLRRGIQCRAFTFQTDQGPESKLVAHLLLELARDQALEEIEIPYFRNSALHLFVSSSFLAL